MQKEQSKLSPMKTKSMNGAHDEKEKQKEKLGQRATENNAVEVLQKAADEL